ncbi:MAG TPA: rhomboid family intramembrane serine protease [Bacteroidota bacterium]|nr:rhomboid family intramembrane serine protease [Bacteroidota bacterium]
MIPIRDTIKTKTFPFVNYLIILACGLVFLYELSLGERIEPFIRRMGVTPSSVSATLFHGRFVAAPALSLLSSMFLHGGWLHLLGNMLYLYIFGDNVEDRIGHGAYLLFYLLCGVSSALCEVYFQQDSTAPLIGASGAIAGVLGAYFLLYPRARVLTIIPLFVFFPVFEIPAFFFLGFWFLMQFVQGAVSSAAGGTASGGVAWWAHAGGFVVGAVLLPLFLIARRR